MRNPALTHPAFRHPALKSLVLALPLAVMVVGAADNTDLPDILQYLLSHLDVATYFSVAGWFGSSASRFEFWALPVNTVFYGSFLYILFSLRGWRPGARESLKPALPANRRVDDSSIPALSTVLDPAKLSQQLQALASSPCWAGLQDVQSRVLELRTHKRCTFEILLRADLVGKIYATDRRDVFEVMEKIARVGFSPEAEFSIPKPVAYLPSLFLLLQERVVGIPAKEVFRSRDEREGIAAAERCGRWLARFQTLAPPLGKVVDAGVVLRRSERKQLFTAKEGGPLAIKAEQLLKALKAAASSLGPAPLCPGHGDFGSYQVMLAAGRTVVFDWDLYDTADPTRDLARFIVSLERQAHHRLGSIHALDAAVEAFLKAYLAAGGHPQVAAHLPFYRAVHYLNGAKRDVQAKASNWRERAEGMLDEGLRVLGGQVQVGVMIDGQCN